MVPPSSPNLPVAIQGIFITKQMSSLILISLSFLLFPPPSSPPPSFLPPSLPLFLPCLPQVKADQSATLQKEREERIQLVNKLGDTEKELKSVKSENGE